MERRGLNRHSLRSLREANKITVREMAVRVGISHSHLANIEAGRRVPSPGLHKDLADALGVDIDAITAVFVYCEAEADALIGAA